MKSLCIKTNNKEIIDYLTKNFNNIQMKIYVSNHSFYKFDNVIIHDINRNEEEFYENVSLILKETIEKYYENKLLEKSIKHNYFYLNNEEQEYIFKISKKINNLPDNKIGYKNKILKESIYNYIIENKSIMLDGFINFRIKKYRKIIEDIVDVSVISYLELISF